MKTFRKTWNKRKIEDDITINSKEAISFCRAFRNMLKRELTPYNIEVVNFSIGHYYLYGFAKKDNDYVYYSYNIPRKYEGVIDFDKHFYAGPVLYRTAKNEVDYYGGSNNFCSIADLPKNIITMFKD